MNTGRRGFTIFLLVAGDAVLLYASLFLSLFLRYPQTEAIHLIEQHLIPFSIIFAVWILLFGAFGLYDLKFMKNSKHFLYRLLRAMSTGAVLAILIIYLNPVFEIEPRRNLALITLVSTLCIFLWRYFFNLLILKTPQSKVLFFGVTKDAVELADFLIKNPQLAQKPVAFMSVNGESVADNLPLPVLAPHQDLSPIIQEFDADTIVISREIKENKTLVAMLFQVIPLGVAVIEFPAFYELNTGKIPLSLIGEVWFLENLVGTRKNFYQFFKRAIDLALSFILVFPAAAILPVVALGIKLNSAGPVFFRQRRIGRNGKEFELIKFRSMVKNAETMSGFKGEGLDPRHTKFGSLLRRSYLDELPQIINILRGEMSFVGPRPERPEYVRELKEKIPFYEMRLLVSPGITGWAQINMENDASVEDAPAKMQYDLYYIKNRTPALDLLIMLKTIFTLLRREGR